MKSNKPRNGFFAVIGNGCFKAVARRRKSHFNLKRLLYKISVTSEKLYRHKRSCFYQALFSFSVVQHKSQLSISLLQGQPFLLSPSAFSLSLSLTHTHSLTLPLYLSTERALHTCKLSTGSFFLLLSCMQE